MKKVLLRFREDLANDCQALTEHSSTEITQLLEEFGDAQIQSALDLEANEAE